MRGPCRRLTLLAVLVGVAVILALPRLRREPRAQPIFTLTDPKGDDHGDGTLMYPLRTDMQPGDLDLVTFSAYAQSGGTVFEATFARSVRAPARRTIDQVGTTLDKIAKLGFYDLQHRRLHRHRPDPWLGEHADPPRKARGHRPGERLGEGGLPHPAPLRCAATMLKAIYVREAQAGAQASAGVGDIAPTWTAISAGVAQDVASSVFFPTRGLSHRPLDPLLRTGLVPRGPRQGQRGATWWESPAPTSRPAWTSAAIIGSEGPAPGPHDHPHPARQGRRQLWHQPGRRRPAAGPRGHHRAARDDPGGGAQGLQPARGPARRSCRASSPPT